MRRLSLVALCLFSLVFSLFATDATADDFDTRVLEQGQRPDDCRLNDLKDLNGYFPFDVPKNLEAWKQRREEVRMRMLVSQGLWPTPTRTPLNPVIHGRLKFEGYTVEKVYFESIPGFFVTGSLYRPEKSSGKHPAILCPHGHWSKGRFYDRGEPGVLQDIVNGAERFEQGGRSPLQSRCVQLARMGCIVFHYDMLGYADSNQLSFDLVHKFAKQRPEMNSAENWGLFSPQAESRLQSVMGLQTWNSIRAVDFVEQLPDVDTKRIAVTGASGGGTQTFMLASLDDRIAVSVPAVMVSTSMQGGCTCENSSLLRVGTGNVEMAAVFAPKPQLLIAAKDWTVELETKGFPEIQNLYALYNAKKNVEMNGLVHFPHNYNYVNRAAMYHFLNRHLMLGLKQPIVEDDFQRLTAAELSVWDEDHPKPPSGIKFERKLLKWLTDDSTRQLATADNKMTGPMYDDIVQKGLDVVIGRNVSGIGSIEYEQMEKQDKGTYLQMAGVLRHTPKRDCKEELPILFCYPKAWNGQVAIWLTSTGKAGLYTGDSLQDDAARLIDRGVAVVGVDLFQQGEFLTTGESLKQTRVVKNPREFAGYTYGFNHSVFARRVHDVMTVTQFIRNHDRKPKQVSLIALDETGPIGIAARAQLKTLIDSAAVNTNGFRFANVDDYRDPYFQPGGAKYDDIFGMLTIAAPSKTWIAGERGDLPPRLVNKFFQADKKGHVTQYQGHAGQVAKHAVDWLLQD